MKKLVVQIMANVAAFYCAVLIFPAIRSATPETGLWAGLILAAVNLLIRPLLFLISLPINFLTLGLFTLLINTWMIMLTAFFLNNSLHIPGFWLALATALIVSVFNILGRLFYRKE